MVAEEQRVDLHIQLPVQLIDQLDQATKKIGGKRKNYQWEIVARALAYYFRTNLSWEDSKKHAVRIVLQKTENGEAKTIDVPLTFAEALKLRDQLNEGIEAFEKTATRKE